MLNLIRRGQKKKQKKKQVAHKSYTNVFAKESMFVWIICGVWLHICRYEYI